MALQDSVLAQALETIFDTMESSARNKPKDNKWFAEELAKAITNQIKTAEISAGKVIISVSGGSGSAAVGTPNPAPIQVV